MQLDDAQKQKVGAWIAEGRSLSDIQKLLESELKLRLTYLEVRLLVDDLKLTPKDAPRVEEKKLVGPEPGKRAAAPPPESEPEPAGNPLSGVSVTVDSLARPGAVVSGSVRFSDGNTATWVIDQTGRLGLMPQKQGYRPSPEDVQEFQLQLQNELQGLGM
jgi:hypothetical protein